MLFGGLVWSEVFKTQAQDTAVVIHLTPTYISFPTEEPLLCLQRLKVLQPLSNLPVANVWAFDPVVPAEV